MLKSFFKHSIVKITRTNIAAFFSFVIIMTSGVQAQFQLSGTMNLAVPVGDWAGYLAGTGYGSKISFQYRFLHKALSVNITPAFVNFSQCYTEGAYDVLTSKVEFFPLTAGIDYYFFKGSFRPFIGIQSGMVFEHNKTNYNLDIPEYGYSVTGNTDTLYNYFEAGARAGVVCDVNKHFGLIASVDYNNVFNEGDGDLNYLTFNGGIIITFGSKD